MPGPAWANIQIGAGGGSSDDGGQTRVSFFHDACEIGPDYMAVGFSENGNIARGDT